MSVLNSTGSGILSTNIPAGFIEAAMLLDKAEKTRNGENPGLGAKNAISITISSDEGLINVQANLPCDTSSLADGSLVYNAKDYLGAAYSVFAPGGSLTATTKMDVLVQIAQMISQAEKTILPVEDQPNFLQIDSSSEAGTINITATIPFTAAFLANSVSILAVDYLPA